MITDDGEINYRTNINMMTLKSLTPLVAVPKLNLTSSKVLVP